MGARARIGIKNSDGSVTSVYTHWDGYPEHHGPLLLAHYATENRVRALLALGDVSTLEPEIEPRFGLAHTFEERQEGVTVFYGRDRGQAAGEIAARTHPPEEWYDSGQHYEYLFDGGSWLYRAALDGRWEKLDHPEDSSEPNKKEPSLIANFVGTALEIADKLERHDDPELRAIAARTLRALSESLINLEQLNAQLKRQFDQAINLAQQAQGLADQVLPGRKTGP